MSHPPIAPVRETASPTRFRNRAGLAAALLAIATTAATLLAGTAQASATARCPMQGSAYATSAHLGSRSAPTAAPTSPYVPAGWGSRVATGPPA
jgi:hypothetical protein